MADISGAFEVDGLIKQKQELEALMTSNQEMEKRLQTIIRKALLGVRKSVQQGAKSAMRTDPRGTYKAVKMSVYKQILGGNVSLLDKRRRSGKESDYEPPRKLRIGQRGGNRVPRSMRTQQVMSYTGMDREWVLRIVEEGTTNRMAGTRNGRLYGNRGRIIGRSFFQQSSQRAMKEAVSYIDKMIQEIIQKEYGK